MSPALRVPRVKSHTIGENLSAAAPAIDFDAAAAKVRVSLFADNDAGWLSFHEIWQGTLGEVCRGWRVPGAVPVGPAQMLAWIDQRPKEGHGCLVCTLPEHWFPNDMRPSEGYFPETKERRGRAAVYVRRTHFYQDQKTGTLYTNGDKIRGGDNWDRSGPIKATMKQTPQRTPLVEIQTGFGMCADYTPAQLRAYAQTLLTIASDAEQYPMGPRSFIRTTRGYDT